jgi:hypothetical protein
MHFSQKIKQKERFLLFIGIAKIVSEILVVTGFIIIAWLLLKNLGIS